MAGRGRAGARATGAHHAAVMRMRQAAEHLRTGHSPGDPAGARASTAQLLDQLADRDEQGGLDIHLHDRAAGLADRILATPPGQLLQNARPVADGYGDNGQPPQRGRL